MLSQLIDECDQLSQSPPAHNSPSILLDSDLIDHRLLSDVGKEPLVDLNANNHQLFDDIFDMIQ